MDTGATTSAVQGDLARELGFKSVAKRLMDAPHGEKETKFYELDMTLPGGLVFYGVHAAELDGLKGIDIVIGMDIMRNSFLMMSGRRQRFWIFFPRRFVVPRSLSSF
ncbi:MAG: aspartyl protease family protein [Alphaproteobacteria bacterium]|nr:aspartyl protease family protein [Alphaproteobacteria bacterium]MDA7988884.1 aspartyl protease family protein [Alphaproteobacteria bacterium]